MAGRFISFEGGEGAGKTTQILRLSKELTARGYDVVTTREPGGTPGAEAIRALLVEGEPARWNGRTEALLMNAARADHVSRAIIPALERGSWVLCDRYAHSTLAYQGHARGMDMKALLALHDVATDGLWPTLTFLLDLPVEAGLGRARGRGGKEARFEGEALAFHQKVHEGFLSLLHEDSCMKRIDAMQDEDAVAGDIWRAVAPLLS
ncbi:MAG: dTMP kinase [Pacificimonas sp.]